jgi:hypothetical protein
MPPYTDSFFTASTATAVTLLAVLLALRADLRWRALVLAAATAPVFAAPFVPGYTRALGLLEITLLTLVATVAALSLRAATPDVDATPTPRRSWALDDVVVFALAVGLSAWVCDRVLERYTVSGDEWADVYQADLFAHLRSYGALRACPDVFKNWWVFEKSGRTFAQYTPGWPLFMAPFERAGVVWISGPVAFGGLAVGIARLARRVAASGLVGARATTPRLVRLAGIFAALAVAASPSALLNGASLYPHTLVCACFAWTVEARFAVSDAPRRRGRVAWGLVLGTASALMLATRPLDGVAIGVGVGAAAIGGRRDVPRAALLAALGAFSAWSALTLVILRQQLGVWFQSAYVLAPIQMHFSAPRLADLPFAVPFDRASPYWWPCAFPIVPLGISFARGRGRRVAWALTMGAVVLVVAYALLEAGRDGAESGYGSRFHLPLVVPMAVAFGVVLAWLVERVLDTARRGARLDSLIDALAALIVVLTAIEGALVIAPTIYPAWHATLHRDHALRRAIAESGIHHAVVVVHQADLAQEVWDLTQNLPTEPDPDTLVLTDWHAEDDFTCARRTYADRQWFIARGHEKVVLSPYDPRTDENR